MVRAERRRQPEDGEGEPLFPPVTGGLRGLPPQQVSRQQRARLEGAMVEAVARHGYSGTTLRELVRLAGVSKSTFYEHFESKQEAFLATSDTIVDLIGERVEDAFEHSTGDSRKRLVTALGTYMEMVAEHPQAATLCTVDVLSLGQAGIEHRERGVRVLEAILAESFERSRSKSEVSDVTVRAIAGGLRGVVYRHLRDGTAAALPGLVEQLADWALGYQRPSNEWLRRAMAAASAPTRPEPADADEIHWDEPPDSPRSRAELSQRDRIVRAVGQLVVETGYDTLGIPAISARAGTSNQTFYENFDGKRDAFFAAFELSAGEALAATSAAFETSGDGVEAIGAGLRAILEYVAASPLFAHIAFFDLQTAGPVAFDRADTMTDRFTEFVLPGKGPGEIDPAPSPTILQAITSGVWSVIRQELSRGESASLPALAPELVWVVLVPLQVR